MKQGQASRIANGNDTYDGSCDFTALFGIYTPAAYRKSQIVRTHRTSAGVNSFQAKVIFVKSATALKERQLFFVENQRLVR